MTWALVVVVAWLVLELPVGVLVGSVLRWADRRGRAAGDGGGHPPVPRSTEPIVRSRIFTSSQSDQFSM
jgi:hypothetical protein